MYILNHCTFKIIGDCIFKSHYTTVLTLRNLHFILCTLVLLPNDNKVICLPQIFSVFFLSLLTICSIIKLQFSATVEQTGRKTDCHDLFILFFHPPVLFKEVVHRWIICFWEECGGGKLVVMSRLSYTPVGGCVFMLQRLKTIFGDPSANPSVSCSQRFDECNSDVLG